MAGLLFFGISAGAQTEPFSENGWKISPRDTIRILVVYAEVDFDTDADKDPQPKEGRFWTAGQMPLYKDSLFDPFSAAGTTAPVTQYFYQMSLGNLVLLGDYVDHLITIPYSQLKGNSESRFKRAVLDSLNAMGEFKTAHGLSAKDFDLWLNESGSGLPKRKNNGDTLEGVDHLMIFVRNHPAIPGSNGRASAASAGELFGQPTNSHSWMGGYHYPFFILKHEFAHLLIGSNNFHAGGGNEAHFMSYFMPLQSGWSLMGGYEQSLMTCSGWDRYWLGWKAPDKKWLISALDTAGAEVSTDLDAEDPNAAGTYILRDFVSTGDVIRLKMPFVPDSTYQQYLWIENHTTDAINGGPFDNFIYAHFDCMERARPGLYLQMQIARDEKRGADIYKGNADFLRALPANGNFDVSWKPEKVDNGWCVGRVNDFPVYRQSNLENALSGSQDQEQIFRWETGTGSLDNENMFRPVIREVRDSLYQYNVSLGLASHGFSERGNSKISIATNPSTASMLTLANRRTASSARSGHPQNNRAVYVNGLSVEILETYGNGAVKILVRLDETDLTDDRRWCAPEIVVSDIPGAAVDLNVSARLTLDFGLTATRFDEPLEVNGQTRFSSPTTMVISTGAVLSVAETGSLYLHQNSELHFRPGSLLKLSPKGKIKLTEHSRLIFEKGSDAEIFGRTKIKLRSGSQVICADETLYRKLKKHVRPVSRLVLQ